MHKAIGSDLGLDLVIGYYQILRRVRRRVKGLKQGHFWAIALLGHNPNGLRICEARMVEPDLHRTSVLQRFEIGMESGLVCKEGHVYKLTDKGRIAFQALQEESAVKRAEIVGKIVNAVKNKI